MNTNILILGAGRSASSLIRYMAEEAPKHDWKITIADHQLALAQQKAAEYPHLEAVAIDIDDHAQALPHIQQAGLVISLLPAFLHPKVAALCLPSDTHLITASYVSDEMQAFDVQAKAKGLLFLNEMGLDPGIDHLSAMEMIDEARAEDGHITSFKSYTGGLIAPQSNDNPWDYKFTWNPRNVVLAGRDGASFLENDQVKHIPYHRLFDQKRLEEIKFDNEFLKESNRFEGYANRDSLQYVDVYGLQGIKTLLRGTLRSFQFCKSWDVFVQMGLTDPNFMFDTKGLTNKKFLNSFLPEGGSLKDYMDVEDAISKKIEWLGLLEDRAIEIKKDVASAAEILQHILEGKWAIAPNDKDMIVMQHILEYQKDTKTCQKVAELVVIGEDAVHTAMAKTVGIPLGIAAKLLMTGKLTLKGVQRPIQKEIYEPALKELRTLGIDFQNKTTIIS